MIGVNSTIQRNNFLRNSSVKGGGGIFLDRAGITRLYQNNFIGNYLDIRDTGYKWADAGAIYFECFPSSSFSMDMCECIIEENLF